ncbi:hypothetical protein [Chitinilyticum litopenaei]|uniref:hypothetical protein n=1 Tax=Chitinilyticum litopenaei TaxID=1121276 RepID=UPI000427D114|nr:hypothetical protein [Chitinilyticum litopenaei]
MQAHDPYTPSRARLDAAGGEASGRSRALLVGNWLLFAAALLAAIVVQLVVPAFRELFAGFGSDLPLLTRLFIDATPLCFLLPLLLLIPALVLTLKREHAPAFRSRMRWISTAGLLLVLGVPVLGAVAMYLPVFAMATPP